MNYKQATQRIEIIVRKDSGDGSNVKVVSSEDGASDKDKPVLAGGYIAKRVATSLIKLTSEATMTGINYYISGIGYREGDTSLQSSAERTMTLVSKVTNVAKGTAVGAVSALATGAAGGAPGGPLGIAIGALIGLTTSLVSTVISTSSDEGSAKRTWNYKQFQEQNSITYKRARAGINLTTGRLR